MQIKDLRQENELLDIFCGLAEIPSPSLHEEGVIEYIENFCKENSINYSLDGYQNVYINVPATNTSKEPLMLSAHMDVVGDNSPVELELDGDFIKANNRTLGSDDKVGVASALLLAKEIINSNLEHGGLEITFTRDEETNMSGIEHVQFDKINSTYVLVCDADKLAQLQISGASYTNAKISVKAFLGGHSGNDIGDKDRLNAAKLIAELINELPQGVFYKDETGVITSCNIGAIIAGGIQNAVSTLVAEGLKSQDYITEINERASTNIINTDAKATYSIRSASVEKEDELKQLMSSIVDKFNAKYKGLAEAEIKFEIHLPPFEKADDERIEKVHTNACKKLGIKNEISSFHAGAETHIYVHKTNKYGHKFKPFLLGLADIYNMHSAREKVDYKSFLKGYNIIKETFIEFNT
ncbi:MAG: M20/M25/M40 family metallo-hydrolase [Candidatus Gastranaerophilaceae bacterium]